MKGETEFVVFVAADVPVVVVVVKVDVVKRLAEPQPLRKGFPANETDYWARAAGVLSFGSPYAFQLVQQAPLGPCP